MTSDQVNFCELVYELVTILNEHFWVWLLKFQVTVLVNGAKIQHNDIYLLHFKDNICA